MQDVINELLKETSYLDPYLRQFLRLLNGKNILLISQNKEYINTKIKDMGYIVDNLAIINNEENKLYDGIILFNTINEVDKSTITELLENTFKSLKDHGYILIILQNNKNSNNYTKEFLDVFMEANYIFTEELNNYDNLKFYIYEKKHY